MNLHGFGNYIIFHTSEASRIILPVVFRQFGTPIPLTYCDLVDLGLKPDTSYTRACMRLISMMPTA